MSETTLYETAHIIAGEPFTGKGTQTAPIFCPATGVQVGETRLADVEDVRHAIEVAEAASAAWADTSPVTRARVIFEFRALMMKDMDNLAEIIAREHGKTVSDAKGEVIRAIDVVEHACGIPSHLRGDNSEIGSSGIEIRSYRMALGTVAAISPFNFPIMIPTWQVVMAIACGNSVVLKPSEKVPTATNRMVELFYQAGLPKGVLNLVNGDKQAVDTLLTDPRIKAVGFVGSTPVARYVYETGTANGKRVQAFGGAKNHAIVMPDANIDFVADSIVGAAYGAAGERCMAISVAVPVGEDTAEALRGALVERVGALRLAPSMDDADFGPVISAEHKSRVNGYVDTGVREGADLVVDGRSFDIGRQGYEDGFYVGASLFDHVTRDMKIYQDEIFGPVLGVARTDDYEEAIDLLNGHRYGNGAAIFTNNGKISQHFLKNAQAGSVGVNVPIPVPLAFYTFGGWKDSSFRSHNMNGQDVVEFYTQLKTATVRFPEMGSDGPAFTMPTFGAAAH